MNSSLTSAGAHRRRRKTSRGRNKVKKKTNTFFFFHRRRSRSIFFYTRKTPGPEPLCLRAKAPELFFFFFFSFSFLNFNHRKKREKRKMNRSFKQSQPLRTTDCNAVEVKSKVSVWEFQPVKMWTWGVKEKSSHGRSWSRSDRPANQRHTFSPQSPGLFFSSSSPWTMHQLLHVLSVIFLHWLFFFLSSRPIMQIRLFASLTRSWWGGGRKLVWHCFPTILLQRRRFYYLLMGCFCNISCVHCPRGFEQCTSEPARCFEFLSEAA